MSEQIECVSRLLSQITKEELYIQKDSAILNAFRQDISLLNALLIWLEAGNEAANFPGTGSDHILVLISPTPMVPEGTVRTQVIYTGEDVLQLPGLTIKRVN